MFDVLDRLRGIASEYPAVPAYVADSQSVTYGAFYRRVCAIAAAFRRRRAAEDSKVAILLPKSADLYAGMYAALYWGGQYSPLSLAAPRDRNAMILDRYQPDLILTSHDHAALIPRSQAHRAVFVEEIAGAEDEVGPRTGNFAYTIFTSGPTGVPKGVHINRRSLDAYIGDSIPALGFKPGLRVSQHPNIAVDLSVLDIYATLSSGATLAPLDSRVDKGFPAKFIQRNGIKIWVSVPSVLDLMERVGQLTQEFLGGVETFFFCGEPFLPEQLRKLRAAAPQARIFNAYGPTEATVSCTLREFGAYRDAYDGFASLPIGEAFGSSQLRLIGGDDENEGEIFIYGEQVANGYWYDSEATDAKFGFDEALGKRWFRTGDWAKIVDGEWCFTGRTDRRIKRFGYRVELGDIESHIRRLASTDEVAVIESDGKLVAFVAGSALAEEALRVGLVDALPDYMQPDELHFLVSLPINPNDTVDYTRLIQDQKDGRFDAVA